MQVADMVENDERPAYVRYERVAIEDKPKTIANGRYVSQDIDFAYITPVGCKDVIEIRVDSWFIIEEGNVKRGRTPARFLEFWKKKYQAFLEGQELPLDGTPIRNWSAISPAQVDAIIAANVLTVEDLAQANDVALQRIGKGAVEMRHLAENYVQAAKDHGPLTMKVTQLEKESATDKATIADLLEKLKLLKAQALAESDVDLGVLTANPNITMDDITPDEFEMVPHKPIVSVQVETTDKPKIDATGLTREVMAELFHERFGKAPHPKIKDETLRSRLME